MSTDRLGSQISTVEIRTAKASVDVRAVLPGLAQQSRRWTRSIICPACSGPKSAVSKTCKSCFGRRKTFARARDRNPTAGQFVVAPSPSGSSHGKTFARGNRDGHVRVQQSPGRFVKNADGAWVEVE